MKSLFPTFTVAIASLVTALASLTWAFQVQSQLIGEETNPRSLNTAKMTISQATSELVSDEVKTVVKGNNTFALDLYNQLHNQQGNLFFSPYSISTALAMTYAGANGQTATEMAQVLHFTLKQERLHSAFAALNVRLNPSDQQEYQLSVANRLWGQKGYSFLDTFLKLTRSLYRSELEQVDFIRDSEQSRRTINRWVTENTQHKIQDLIPEGFLGPSTRLVLTNAIYFKGAWASQFNPQDTKDKPFSITTNQQVNVPTMYQEAALPYVDLGNLQVLELPYGNGSSDVESRLSMVILLPKKVEGLAELEQQLTSDNLVQWLSSLGDDHGNVQIWLPKFKVISEFELKQALSKMGMAIAFDRKLADFSGMTGKRELFISKAIHKTFMNVNESGTEASVATGAVIAARGGSGTFRADHPFLFLIRDTKSGSILFLGRVVNPLASPAGVGN